MKPILETDREMHEKRHDKTRKQTNSADKTKEVFARLLIGFTTKQWHISFEVSLAYGYT